MSPDRLGSHEVELCIKKGRFSLLPDRDLLWFSILKSSYVPRILPFIEIELLLFQPFLNINVYYVWQGLLFTLLGKSGSVFFNSFGFHCHLESVRRGILSKNKLLFLLGFQVLEFAPLRENFIFLSACRSKTRSFRVLN